MLVRFQHVAPQIIESNSRIPLQCTISTFMEFDKLEYEESRFCDLVKCGCSSCKELIPRLKRDIATDIRLNRSSWRCERCRSVRVVHSKICEYCQAQFQAPSKNYKFCSASCAAKLNLSKRTPPSVETRKKISQGIRRYNLTAPAVIRREKTKKCWVTIQCKHCTKTFVRRYDRGGFCSQLCFKEFHRLQKPAWRIYSEQCAFKFNVYDYPDYFDIELLNQYGWYSPSNKNNNLNGVSRDHCISVKWGFDNDIDPKLISHPANCRLVRHTDNQLKSFKCSITIDQLKQQIDQFDKFLSAHKKR